MSGERLAIGFADVRSVLMNAQNENESNMSTSMYILGHYGGWSVCVYHGLGSRRKIMISTFPSVSMCVADEVDERAYMVAY